MENNRKKITLPLTKKEVIVKEWITAGERKAIDTAGLAGIEFDSKGNTTKKFDAVEITKEKEKETVGAFIVSFAGNENLDKETLYNSLLQLPDEDFKYLLGLFDSPVLNATQGE